MDSVPSEVPQFIDGEPVLLRVRLAPEWKKYRCITCGLACIAGGYGLPLCLAYWLCAADCRQEEANSFTLALTPTALHYRMKVYDCGVCCQKTTIKTVPLDKIQDVMLISDCCGDCCGFVPRAGTPYRILVQTAGLSGGPEGVAELSLQCIEDPEGFRARVMAAKRALTSATNIPHGGAAGAGKEQQHQYINPAAGALSPVAVAPYAGGAGYATAPYGGPGFAPPGGYAPATDMRPVLAVLERIEAALNEGLTRVHAAQPAAR
jgi:hypothetical protein